MLQLIVALASVVAVFGIAPRVNAWRNRTDAPTVAEPTVLRFKSHVGILSPFFVPRASGQAPTAQMVGPSGAWDLRVTEAGDRWCVSPPGPWLATGVYQITVSSGEQYEILVQPPRPYLRPAELKRWRRLSPVQQAELIAAFSAKE